MKYTKQPLPVAEKDAKTAKDAAIVAKEESDEQSSSSKQPPIAVQLGPVGVAAVLLGGVLCSGLGYCIRCVHQTCIAGASH